MTDSHKIFDGLLVLQYRSGVKKALTTLVNKYHNKFCRHAYFYTHDRNAAKDIVQDCWGIIISKLDRLKDPNLFSSWAFRIVTRKSLDFVNKQKREHHKLQQYYNEKKPVEAETDITKEIQKLTHAIRSLPKDQQVVIRLFYTENYSLKEISTILEVSIGTVKSRLFHAREKLKSIIKKE